MISSNPVERLAAQKGWNFRQTAQLKAFRHDDAKNHVLENQLMGKKEFFGIHRESVG